MSYAYWYSYVFFREMPACIFQWVFHVLVVELYTKNDSPFLYLHIYIGIYFYIYLCNTFPIVTCLFIFNNVFDK